MSRYKLYYRPEHPLADQHGFVDQRDLQIDQTERALDAPIMVDRFYEGATVPVYEGGAVKVVDIGTRKRHREYMKQNGLTTTDDFDKPGGYWERAAKERENVAAGTNDRKERREALAKMMYEVEKRDSGKRRN